MLCHFFAYPEGQLSDRLFCCHGNLALHGTHAVLYSLFGRSFLYYDLYHDDDPDLGRGDQNAALA